MVCVCVCVRARACAYVRARVRACTRACVRRPHCSAAHSSGVPHRQAQDEIGEMKRTFKIMSHQVEQLKEEVTSKAKALAEEHKAKGRVENELKQRAIEVEELRRMKAKADGVLEKMAGENEKLNQMISRMDGEALNQRKEYDQVINERDILGTQLIRRNDELALLYEKIKIMQSTLRKGEAQYMVRVWVCGGVGVWVCADARTQQRMEEVRMLKIEVKRVRRQMRLAQNQVGQVKDLTRVINQLQRELLQEKTKVGACVCVCAVCVCA